MNQNILDILPAIRMIVSLDTLKAVSFWPEKEVNVDFGLKDIWEVKSADIDSIVESVNHVKLRTTDVIYIKGEGYIVIANSQAELFLLKEGTLKEMPAPTGRVANRIFIITGGAQGFGAGVAEEIFNQGGNVVIADLNEEKGQAMAKSLNASGKENKAVFISANVSDPASVEKMVNQTVEVFGGLDVMVSNAGILRAGGLDEMTPETFKLMTDVNYTGFFYCAKYASKVMKVQTSYKKDFYCDIIQINSKSGLKGSKKNFAYAGGKFGGIGLTQSFALELMEFNVKVNSICPGNFFDGPLWSDPERGLFVQYLKAGKVPGAQTVADVKNFYERQVPARRGCRVIDVARAIFYVVEQEYETGQAIPVTGGQEMLK